MTHTEKVFRSKNNNLFRFISELETKEKSIGLTLMIFTAHRLMDGNAFRTGEKHHELIDFLKKDLEKDPNFAAIKKIYSFCRN